MHARRSAGPRTPVASIRQCARMLAGAICRGVPVLSDGLPPTAAPGVPAPDGVGAEVRVKPRLRGVFHQYAFFVSLGSGAVLVLLAGTTRAVVAVTVYAVSVSALFGVSALYHRATWTGPARRRMRRLGSCSSWPGLGRPDGLVGPSTWRSAGWRWWRCRSCLPTWG